jgi:parallel beta-helix repeat protein
MSLERCRLRRTVPLIALLALAGPALTPAPLASGTGIIRVPIDFPTIQEAIDAAGPGAIIQVAQGVYCENLLITKSDLSLRTQPGPMSAVLDGSCLGGLGHGFHIMGASNVEVMGFTVQYFEWGFHIHSTNTSRIHLNEVRFMATGPGLAPGSRGNAILLENSSFNTVSQNNLHDNGHLGVGLLGPGSTGNMVRGNRIADNNLEATLLLGSCSVMPWNGASYNWIVENEITGTRGVGIMLGPTVNVGNHVAQNRVHGFANFGILANSPAADNFIGQNDVQGNGWGRTVNPVDMYDFSIPSDNVWRNNRGTCVPDMGVC